MLNHPFVLKVEVNYLILRHQKETGNEFVFNIDGTYLYREMKDKWAVQPTAGKMWKLDHDTKKLVYFADGMLKWQDFWGNGAGSGDNELAYTILNEWLKIDNILLETNT